MLLFVWYVYGLFKFLKIPPSIAFICMHCNNFLMSMRGLRISVCMLYVIFNVILLEVVRLNILVRCPLSPVDRNLGDDNSLTVDRMMLKVKVDFPNSHWYGDCSNNIKIVICSHFANCCVYRQVWEGTQSVLDILIVINLVSVWYTFCISSEWWPVNIP